MLCQNNKGKKTESVNRNSDLYACWANLSKFYHSHYFAQSFSVQHAMFNISFKLESDFRELLLQNE
jgi:hypothetical protein